jgi:hypothetical protein
MNPPILDQMIAGPEEVDPTHIMALATRVKNLGEADDKLAEQIEKLLEMLDKRLPTEAEMMKVREMLANEAGKEYLQRQFIKYGVGGLGLLATIAATRSYVSVFLSWLASVLK